MGALKSRGVAMDSVRQMSGAYLRRLEAFELAHGILLQFLVGTSVGRWMESVNEMVLEAVDCNDSIGWLSVDDLMDEFYLRIGSDLDGQQVVDKADIPSDLEKSYQGVSEIEFRLFLQSVRDQFACALDDLEELRERLNEINALVTFFDMHYGLAVEEVGEDRKDLIALSRNLAVRWDDYISLARSLLQTPDCPIGGDSDESLNEFLRGRD
ncbi:MAG: hypothetical protein KJ843_24900 [Alphaproteobacteria bacterium]|nr:hypothetical protein [Alphaproteobacteria bacterium]